METTPEEYFRKWAENCRVFINYKPIHDHEDMMRFAKDFHAEKLKSHVISDTLTAWEQYKKENWWESDSINVEEVLKNQFSEIYTL